MSITLYNTLTRRKEAFVPLDPANVRMYVCGPTVYDYAHIGNARPVIVFDVLFRLLRQVYGPDHVTYARNITDVDDKINARAAEEKVTIRDLTERTAAQFHADIAALGVLPPTVEPRATDHIPEMRALCESARQERARLRRRRPRAVRRLLDGRLRPARQPQPGGDGGRCPRRRRALQEGADGLRAVEAVEVQGEAVVAGTVRDRGAGPAGLAPRMLGDERKASRAGVRHPRRRHRPGVPASRERDRPEPLRARHAGDGQRLDAQRLPAGRRREDVEVARQLHHHQPAAGHQRLRRPAAGTAASCGSPCSARTIASRSTGRWSGWCRRAPRWPSSRDAIHGVAPSGAPHADVQAALEDDLNTPCAISILHGLGKSAKRGNADTAGELKSTLQFMGLYDNEKPDAFFVGADCAEHRRPPRSRR